MAEVPPFPLSETKLLVFALHASSTFEGDYRLPTLMGFSIAADGSLCCEALGITLQPKPVLEPVEIPKKSASSRNLIAPSDDQVALTALMDCCRVVSDWICHLPYADEYFQILVEGTFLISECDAVLQDVERSVAAKLQESIPPPKGLFQRRRYKKELVNKERESSMTEIGVTGRAGRRYAELGAVRGLSSLSVDEGLVGRLVTALFSIACNFNTAIPRICDANDVFASTVRLEEHLAEVDGVILVPGPGSTELAVESLALRCFICSFGAAHSDCQEIFRPMALPPTLHVRMKTEAAGLLLRTLGAEYKVPLIDDAQLDPKYRINCQELQAYGCRNVEEFLVSTERWIVAFTEARNFLLLGESQIDRKDLLISVCHIMGALISSSKQSTKGFNAKLEVFEKVVWEKDLSNDAPSDNWFGARRPWTSEELAEARERWVLMPQIVRANAIFKEKPATNEAVYVSASNEALKIADCYSSVVYWALDRWGEKLSALFELSDEQKKFLVINNTYSQVGIKKRLADLEQILNSKDSSKYLHMIPYDLFNYSDEKLQALLAEFPEKLQRPDILNDCYLVKYLSMCISLYDMNSTIPIDFLMRDQVGALKGLLNGIRVMPAASTMLRRGFLRDQVVKTMFPVAIGMIRDEIEKAVLDNSPFTKAEIHALLTSLMKKIKRLFLKLLTSVWVQATLDKLADEIDAMDRTKFEFEDHQKGGTVKLSFFAVKQTARAQLNATLTAGMLYTALTDDLKKVKTDQDAARKEKAEKGLEWATVTSSINEMQFKLENPASLEKKTRKALEKTLKESLKQQKVLGAAIEKLTSDIDAADAEIERLEFESTHPDSRARADMKRENVTRMKVESECFQYDYSKLARTLVNLMKTVLIQLFSNEQVIGLLRQIAEYIEKPWMELYSSPIIQDDSAHRLSQKDEIFRILRDMIQRTQNIATNDIEEDEDDNEEIDG